MAEYTLIELKAKVRELYDYIYEFSRANQPNIFKRLDGSIEVLKRSADYAKNNYEGDPILRLKLDRAYYQGWIDCIKFMEEDNNK